MGEPLNERQQRNIIDWNERIEELEEDDMSSRMNISAQIYPSVVLTNV